jgi:hypothetical protein
MYFSIILYLFSTFIYAADLTDEQFNNCILVAKVLETDSLTCYVENTFDPLKVEPPLNLRTKDIVEIPVTIPSPCLLDPICLINFKP